MDTFVLRNETIKNRCIKAVVDLLACDSPKYQVEIKAAVRSKTSQQRKYFHKILSLICEYTGDNLDDLKMELKYRVLPLKEIEFQGRIHLYPISSEKTTTKQYGELIDAAIMYANAAKVTIPQPDYWGIQI